MAWPFCSFCGLESRGGVAGSTPELYICPDCIRRAAQLIRADQPDCSAEDPPPSGR